MNTVLNFSGRLVVYVVAGDGGRSRSHGARYTGKIANSVAKQGM